MLKYRSFPIEEEEKINAFLEENKEGVSCDGIAYLDGMVIFMYSDLDREEREREAIAGSIRKTILDAKSLLAAADHKKRYYKGEAEKGVKGADNDVMKAKEEYESIDAQIFYSYQLLEEVESLAWDGLRMPVKIEKQ